MKKYLVDRISEDCIRVYPEKQEEAVKQCEVKKREFTLNEFKAVCAKAPIKQRNTPEKILSNYVSKKFVGRNGDRYIISDKVCRMYNIE